MAKIIKGYWDCQYCGQTGVDGGAQNCPACGHQRDDGVTFYMKEVEYVSEEEAAKVSENPDWQCSFCGALNSDGVSVCKGCGASRADSERNYFDVQKAKQEAARKEAEAQNGEKKETAPAKRKPIWLVVLLLAVVGLVLLLSPKTKDAVITDYDWARTIQIQESRVVSESDWSLPDGATLTNQRREISGYRSVLDHYESVPRTRTRRVQNGYETKKTYEDMGNGYFREVEYTIPIYEDETYTEYVDEPVYRQEPVYGTKYYYTIPRWVNSRTVDTAGKDHEPYWGEPGLTENERESGRAELYRVAVDVQGNRKTYTVDENTWKTLEKGAGVRLKQYSGGEADILNDQGESVARMRPY